MAPGSPTAFTLSKAESVLLLLCFRHNFSLLARVIFKVAVNFNPLAALRASGPYGSSMIRRLRGDIIGLFDQLFPQDLSEEERFALSSEVIASYLFHLNGHNPT